MDGAGNPPKRKDGSDECAKVNEKNPTTPYRCSVTSLSPKPINIVPIAFWSHFAIPSLRRRPAVIDVEMKTRVMLTAIPMRFPVTPSSSNCTTGLPAWLLTNCGRRAKKKIATLGLSTSLKKPCQKITWPALSLDSFPSMENVLPLDASVRSPR